MFVVVDRLSLNQMQTSGTIGIFDLSTRYWFRCCLVALMCCSLLFVWLDNVTTYRDTEYLSTPNVTTYRDTEYLSLLDSTLTFTGGVNENSFPF